MGVSEKFTLTIPVWRLRGATVTLCYIICAFEPDDEISSDSQRSDRCAPAPLAPVSLFKIQTLNFFESASESESA